MIYTTDSADTPSINCSLIGLIFVRVDCSRAQWTPVMTEGNELRLIHRQSYNVTDLWTEKSD